MAVIACVSGYRCNVLRCMSFFKCSSRLAEISRHLTGKRILGIFGHQFNALQTERTSAWKSVDRCGCALHRYSPDVLTSAHTEKIIATKLQYH